MKLYSTEPQHYLKPTPIPHVFYLYDDIGEPSDYVDLIYHLDVAGPDDVFHLHIATGGGLLDSAIAIIHAIMRTQATVIGFADAMVASAGTLIFFACHSYCISPFSTFMLHDGSSGAIGKLTDSIKNLHATRTLISDIAHQIYEPIFSSEEIDHILEGSDLYLTADEVLERINKCYPMPAEEEEEEKPEPVEP